MKKFLNWFKWKFLSKTYFTAYVERYDEHDYRVRVVKHMYLKKSMETKSELWLDAVGGSTVWYYYPSGVRCSTNMEIYFQTIYRKWKFSGKPSQPVPI